MPTDLIKSEPVAIDWCFFSARDDAVQYQLIGFCDASTITYAAVIYIIQITPSLVLKLVLPLCSSYFLQCC